jgi:hypothetical protein
VAVLASGVFLILSGLWMAIGHAELRVTRSELDGDDGQPAMHSGVDHDARYRGRSFLGVSRRDANLLRRVRPTENNSTLGIAP